MYQLCVCGLQSLSHTHCKEETNEKTEHAEYMKEHLCWNESHHIFLIEKLD